MSPATKYQHRKIAARALLLTGYLVLFTIQFSYRYFDIANFFVYKAHFASIQSAHHQQKLATHTYQDNTKRPAHLAIDKRFSHKLMFQPVPVANQAPVHSYIVINRKALPPPVTYLAPDLPSNALRGPPTV
jgi:hypothetical protein